MRSYATCSNVVLKLSGLGMFDHDWTVATVRPYVMSGIQIFGSDRCMLASNFPVDKLVSTYDQLYDAYRQIIADLPESVQKQVLSENAKRCYRLQ